ncbi:MAG: hypothetical protein ACYC3I_23745 [Gemmataceae bacterium]
MHRAWLILVVSLCCATGCTSMRLRQRTVNQASTLSELQYQQILNNLAQFAVNPTALPSHANLMEGTTQVTDSISGGSLIDLGPPAVTQPQLFGSRTVVAQWGMLPVIDPTELRLLYIAYRRAHGFPDMPSPDFLNELAHELKDQFATNVDLRYESAWFYELQSRSSQNARDLEARIVSTNDESVCPQAGAPGDHSPLARNVCRKIEEIQRNLAQIQAGWFHVGRKRDVPKGACYVGMSGDCYAWVCPDGCKELTEFTLIILKLSSLIKETPMLVNPSGSVKFSPGDRGG